MKPLSIRCGTCDSKLRVTRPEMLGQRLKCPKCGAKVAVPSAEEVEAAGADTQEVASLGPEGNEPFSDFGDIEALLSAERKRQNSGSESLLPSNDSQTNGDSKGNSSKTRKSKTSASPKSEEAALTSASALSQGSQGSESVAGGNVDAKVDAKVDRSLLDPTASWTSAEAAARQRLIAWGAIAVVVGIIAVGSVVLLIRELTRPDSGAEVSSNDPGAATGDSNDSTGDDPSTETGDSNSGDSGSGDSSDDSEQADPHGDASGDSTDTNHDTSSDPTAEPTPEDVAVTPETEVTNPLESLLPSAPDPNEDPGTVAVEDVARPFDLMLDDLSALSAIMEETPFDKARVLADQALRVAYRSQVDPHAILIDRPKPRDVKLTQQLEMELHGVAIEPLPLSKFLDFISRLTKVAIHVEPAALRATNVSMSDLVTPSPTATNVQNLLTETLLTMDLGFEVEGDLIVISFPNASIAESRDYDVSGLGVIGTANPELLTEVVKAMIAPESWSEGSGNSIGVTPGTITIVQRPLVHDQIAGFLAQWSAAVAGTEPPAGSVVSESEAESRARAKELLAKRISIERLQAIPLKQLASDLSEVSGGTILVDWQVLAADGWTGDTELPCNAFDQPLSVALDDTLHSAGLAFRVLDAQTLQITTLVDLLQSPEVRFYDVRELVARGITDVELANRLPQVIRPVGPQDPTKRFFFDPDRAMLIAAVPQPQQQALERFLGAWTEFSRPVSSE